MDGTRLPRRRRSEAPPRRPGVLLAVACAAQFVCVLDTSIVNVALPPMQESLGLSPTGLQWVVSSYTLTFAGFLLLGGRVGDLFGRKRAFVAGLRAVRRREPGRRAGAGGLAGRRGALRPGRGRRRAGARPPSAWSPRASPSRAREGQGAEPAHRGGRRRRGARRRDRRGAHRAAQLALGVLRQRAAGRRCCWSPRSGRCPAGRRGTSAASSTCPARSRSPSAPRLWSRR